MPCDGLGLGGDSWALPATREYNLFGYEGMREWSNLTGNAPAADENDFETKGVEIFEVKAGKTTIVTLDCTSPGTTE